MTGRPLVGQTDSAPKPTAKDLDRVALEACSGFCAHLRDPDSAETWDSFEDAMNRLIGIVEARTGQHV